MRPRDLDRAIVIFKHHTMLHSPHDEHFSNVNAAEGEKEVAMLTVRVSTSIASRESVSGR